MASVVILIYQTGGPQSVFIALWMAIAIFAGVFGTLLIVIIAIALLCIIGYLLFAGAMTPELVSVLALAGIIPLSTGYLMWHGKTSTEKTKERAYYDMATELDQESSKAEVVINAINDGVISINNNGQIELINPAAQRIVGWGNQDALNLDYKSVLKLLDKTGHELEKSTDPVFTVLTTNQPEHRSDLQIQTSSGKKIEAEVFVSALGKIGSGAIIVFRDVTKERAEGKAQAEFISTASHEMRTPVASIEGYLGLALNPATAQIDDKARDFIGKAHEAAQHLGRLFQDLLDITKADDGRLQNNPKPIDLVSFTANIVDGLRMKADEKKLRLFYKPNNNDTGGTRSVAPVYYVNLDNDHLREVLSNLVENAVKYTPEGQVTVDIQGDQEHVTVSISDSGIGIPAEDIPHLFQKFYRVDNTDTREIGGTGLGLYLCRRLIETMGGRIWVESEYKKGSTFFVELPRISHAEANRIIESAKDETISDKKTQYINGADEEMLEGITELTDENSADDEDHRQTALSTPIILSHGDDSRKKSEVEKPKAPEPTAVETISPAPAKPETQAPAVKPINVAAPISENNISIPIEKQETIDPLTGSSEAVTEAAEPLRPKNPMVVPGSIKDMPSTLQTAPKVPETPQAPVAATAPEPAAAASILADLAAAKPTTSAPKPAATHGPPVAPIAPPSENTPIQQPSAADQLKNFIEANPARTAPTIPKLGQREIPLTKQVATPRGIAIPKR